MHKPTLLSALLICALALPTFAEDAADLTPQRQQTMERSKQQIESDALLNQLTPSELQAKRLFMHEAWKQMYETVNYSPTRIVYTSRPNRSIPDNNVIGIADTIQIPAGPVGFIGVRIDTLRHTFVGDLRIRLFAPAGDSVVLANRNGGSGDNMRGTFFTDTASRAFSAVVTADSPFTGFYRPATPLAAFQRTHAAGGWILRVADYAGIDTGALVRWSIIIEAGDVTGPAITHTALTNTSSTAARVASATLADASGIQRSTAGAPRLYHRTGTAGAFTAATSDSNRTGIWYFTIPGRTAPNTVQYYVAAQDSANNATTSPSGGSGINPPGSTAPATFHSYLVLPSVNILYDNGGVATGTTSKSGVVAPAGTQWSEVQNPSGDTTQSNTVGGFSAGITTTVRFRLADNFTIPAGAQWRIDSIVTYAYQTGANPAGPSPFISANLRIWSGQSDTTGSTVVWGDTTANVLGASIFSSVYRIFNTRYPPPGTVPGTTRPLWLNSLRVGTTLGAGTYWLDWQTQVTASAAHFAPSVTVIGRRGNPAWNGRQRTANNAAGWVALIDAGNPAAAPDSAQDNPFQIIGATVVSPPVGWTARTSGTTVLLQSVKQVNANVIWAAGNTAVVRKSVDGGVTWTNGNPATPSVITGDIYNIEALDANNAWCTTSPGATFIYRTVNGGTTWTQVFTQAGGFINAIKMFSATNGIAEGDPVGTTFTIVTTADGGATWTRNAVANEPVPVGGEFGLNNSLSAVGSTHIWFGSSVGPVWRSTNGGTAWTRFVTTFTGNNLEVHFNNTLNGVTGNSAGLANRSTDGGATWVATTIAGTGGVNGLSGAAFEFFASKGTNVYRSTDKGATWAVSYTGAIGTLSHLDFYSAGGTTASNFYGTTVSQTGGIATFFGPLVTGVKNENAGIPEVFALDQNYPNPFNPTTTIRFALPEAANVNLSVYNVLGQRVATLTNETHNAGVYNATWNGRNDANVQVASGMYFFRIEANATNGGATFTSLKKAMLLK